MEDCKGGPLVRVLLVNPATPLLWDPRIGEMMGILYVGAALKEWTREKPEISFWDGNYTDPMPEETDILMVTANSGTYPEAERVASQIKASLKIVGGPHPTSTGLSPDSFFDVAVMGEGEQTITELYNVYSIRHNIGDLVDIKGTAVRRGDKVIINPIREFLDIDAIPWPARDLWPELGSIVAVASKGTKAGLGCGFITSRGCPFECNFCDLDMWRRKVRLRNVDDVLAEVKHLRDTYGITHLRFQDDMINLNKPRFKRLCYGLKELGIMWRAHTRTDHVSLEEFRMMKECGCVEIGLGVESGSQRILDLMRKHNTVEHHEQAIEWTHQVGLNARPYMIIGFPGETWESIKESDDFIRRTKPAAGVTLSTFVPYPGSAVWKDPEKFGAKITSTDWSRYWLIGLEDTDQGFISETPSISKEELIAGRKMLYATMEEVCGSRDRRKDVSC